MNRDNNIRPRERPDGTVYYQVRITRNGQTLTRSRDLKGILLTSLDAARLMRAYMKESFEDLIRTPVEVELDRLAAEEAAEEGKGYRLWYLCEQFIAQRRRETLPDGVEFDEDGEVVWTDDFQKWRWKEARRPEEAKANHLVGALYHGKRLRSITPADIVAALEKIRKRNPRKPMKGATLNRYRSIASQMFGYAIDKGWLQENPAHPKAGRRRREPEPLRYEERWLEEHEKAKFLSVIMNPAVRALYHLAFATGLRRGELLSLRWDSLNLQPEGEGSYLVVRAAYAKSGETRVVPLNSESLAVLKGTMPGDTEPSGLVFGDVTESAINYWRIKANRKLEWDKKDIPRLRGWRLHDCRHHFASQLVMRGVSIYKVKEVLGHSSVIVTERYAHLAKTELWDDVERVSAPTEIGLNWTEGASEKAKGDKKSNNGAGLGR